FLLDDGDPLPASSASGARDKAKKGAPVEKRSVIKDIGKIIQEEKDRDAEKAAAAKPGLPDATSHASRPRVEDPDDREWSPKALGLPEGSVVPEGGYQSVLPDDDTLPAELDADPCADAKLVSSLPGIILGVTLAKNLAVDLGGCVQVTSPTIGFSYSKGAIRAPVAKQFRVTGIFEAGFDQYDSKLVYTDLYEAQAFYDGGDTVTGVEMKVDDIDRANRVSAEIKQLLGSGLYYTMDWEELNHGLFTALRIQQIMMSIVLALIIVVAAFTVIATLIMVVLDKKKEIAVIKAMGAKDDAILRAFLYQGGIIGTLGTAAGLVLGYGVCRALLAYPLPLDPKVYFISRLPVAMHASDFVLVGVFAVVVCLFATVWPALHAAMLRPAEAFRENR
ncbi:MAG TPA: ABC transporter permease, partial [Polyangiaceae bacterium]